MKTRTFVLSVLAASGVSGWAQESAEQPSRFAFHCEWKEGDAKKWEMHHVNLPYKIVDGKPAAIEGSTIVFVQDGVERRIDLQSGVMQSRSLAQGAGAQVEIRECRRVPALPL